VAPPKEPKGEKRAKTGRIEVLGPTRPELPAVTTQLVAGVDRRSGDRRRPRDGDPAPVERQGGAGGRRRERAGGERPHRDAARRHGPTGSGEGSNTGRDGTATDRYGSAGGRRDDSLPQLRLQPTTAASGSWPSPDQLGDRRSTPSRSRAPRAGSRPRRLNAGNTHRQAVMASLPPEQQPIAEQVLRGGIPAVRTAIHLEREKAAAEGRPAPDASQLLAMAEQLLPRLRGAEWRDRAEAASRAIEQISLRDLRSVVAGADAARDEEARALAASLREALDERVDKLRSTWVEEITQHLDERRAIRALRLSGQPPEPTARLPPELAARLSAAAGAAMAPTTPPEQWLALLEAVADSPVRRSVAPEGLPAEPGPELRRAAHQQSGRVPALAAMLGVSMPPPPGPVTTRGEAGRRSRAAGGSLAAPRVPAGEVSAGEVAPLSEGAPPVAAADVRS